MSEYKDLTGTAPILIEPGVQYFLKETLVKCKNTKNEYYNYIFNISLGVGVIVLIFVILTFKYKGKLTPKEKEKKNREKEVYIMSKIRNYQNAKIKQSNQLLTNLPVYKNDYEIMDRNFYS